MSGASFVVEAQSVLRRSPDLPTMLQQRDKVCTVCHRAYASLTQHLLHWPSCDEEGLLCKAVVVYDGASAVHDADVLDSGGDDLAENFATDALQATVAADLAELRFEYGMSGKEITVLKKKVAEWRALEVDAMVAALRPHLKDDVTESDIDRLLEGNIFQGLETESKEMAAAQYGVAALKPTVVQVGPEDTVVSFNVAALLEHKLQHDKVFRRTVLAKSEEYKRGEQWKKQPEDKIASWEDGTAARWHPHLMRPATSEEVDDVRIPLCFNCDDIEVSAAHARLHAARACRSRPSRMSAAQVANPLGPARGKHKQCGCQLATLSLPTETRFKHKNILVPAMARASVYKKHGMARVLCGVDQSGKQHDEPNFARCMRDLDDGVVISIPDDVHGGSRPVRLRAWVIVVSADYLAAQSVLPFVESGQAHHFCRQCTVSSQSPEYGRPFSFLRRPADSDKRARDDSPQLRQWDDLSIVLQRLKNAGTEEAKILKQQHGLNKTVFAFDPQYIPHVIPTSVAPQDGLHWGPDGLLRSEGAWLHYVLFKLGLDPARENEAIRNYPHWPADVRIPPVHPGLSAGTRNGCPHSSTVMRMTGSQMHWFALHSIQLLTPLLTEEMRSHPAWRSWVALVELYSLLVQHEFSVSDVELIDELQLAHSAAFDCVPEYSGLKRPKHHFAQHFPHDLWLYGPKRGCWCFGFEGFNRVIKAGAARSNWKCETLSIMQYWSIRMSRLYERARMQCTDGESDDVHGSHVMHNI